MLFDPEKHDPADVEAAMRPERVARLREIARETMALQVEAGEIMRAEAERLSGSDEESASAHQAFLAFYHVISCGALAEAAEEVARPAS